MSTLLRRHACRLPTAASRVGVGASRQFLPGLMAGLSSPQQRRRTQKWQRVVHHPRETIYEVVAAVDEYAQFLPWCMDSRVLTRDVDEHGVGELSTEIRVGFELMQSTFSSKVWNTIPLRAGTTSTRTLTLARPARR